MPRCLRSSATLLLACLALLAPASSVGSVPMTTVVEGLLTSGGGGPASDGEYVVTFSLYEAADSAASVWKEVSVGVQVKGGAFSHLLGSLTPIDPKVFAGLQAPWLGVQVSNEPELPRKPLLGVPFAWRAGAAESLLCSGCVTAQMIDPAALAGFAKAADLADVAVTGAYADLSGAPSLLPYAKSASLAKVATSGSYADLLGAPALGKACGTGLVLQGFKADGSYDCVSGGLPPDGLNEVSNNLLSNEFVEVVSATKLPVGLPDNNPLGATAEVDVPDLGTARKLTVSVEVTNSDLSTVQVLLFDPANTQYLLHDKTGKAGDALKTSFPTPSKTLSGDLTTWVGKNPKGKWRLQAIDGKYLNNSSDGAIVAFSVTVETLSSAKVESKGNLLLTGGVKLPVSSGPPFACDAAHYGQAYVDSKTDEFFLCVGKWLTVVLRVCGNGILEVTEECDNGGNNGNAPDKCRLTCIKPKCGDKIVDSGEGCDDGNNIPGDGCEADCEPPAGQAQFTSPGTVLWEVPAGVSKISVLGVGAGGGGGGGTDDSNGGRGGGGGALVFANSVPVTPGEILTLVVGGGGEPGTHSASGKEGGATELRRGATVLLRAAGGSGGGGMAGPGVAGGEANVPALPLQTGGGSGGGSGVSGASGGSGGGGAGGYTGTGGAGGTEMVIGNAGAGGGGAGGDGSNDFGAGAGGGVGLQGLGANGQAQASGTALNGAAGGGGSGGAAGSAGSQGGPGGTGGAFGGGGGGAWDTPNGTGGKGGGGALRFLWGGGRSFPSNAKDM
jgi:cysteine-rich repeat protein